MCVDKIAHEVRTQEWFSIIQACNTSGQPKKQWCEENGISIRKFFYWQKKIRAGLYTETKKDTANIGFFIRQILASAIPVSVLYPGKPAVIKKKAGAVRQRSGPNFSIRAKSVFYITH